MRLLVTNTQAAQAYAIIRALRPFATTVVASLSGRHLWSLASCHAAYSRLVDRRCRTPHPDASWRRGVIQHDNTDEEGAFVSSLLRICERERIDTIFPSMDAWVYVLSKNMRRFSERGVTIPVPDYPTVLSLLDKYRTIQLAQEVGFPCPRTVLAESDEEVADLADELQAPWVIKPRFTAGSAGLRIVTRRSELIHTAREIRKKHGAPMIQEYVPGKARQNFYLVMDRQGEAVSIFAPRILRYSRRLFRTSTAACESADPPPGTGDVVRLARKVGWWGGLTVQTKIDARDGVPKLMEINPRLGTHLWFRTELGINEPLMCVRIARGEDLGPVPAYPRGCLLLQPAHDAVGSVFELLDLAAYRIRTSVFGRDPVDASNQPMSLREIGRLIGEQYGGTRRRCFNPHYRYSLSDPLPAILYLGVILHSYGRAARTELGR